MKKLKALLVAALALCGIPQLATTLSRSSSDRLRSIGERLYLSTAYVPYAGADDIEGARGTGNVAANLLETDFATTVLELDANKMPLLVLTARLNKESCKVPKFTWFENAPDPRFDAINNGSNYTSTATSLVVDNGAYFHADDIVLNSRTNETFRVTSVSTNTLTVVRGVGTTAVAMLDNDELIIISSAAQEGAADKAARSQNPDEVYNYTQIFRKPVDETGTKESSADRTSPSDWDRVLNEQGIEHGKDIEYQALLGHPSLDTSGSHPRRTTGGFNHYCTQNVTDVGGTMTEAEFFDALRNPFRYTPQGTKLALCAAKPVDIINAYPRSKLQVIQGNGENGTPQTYGLRMVQLITPHGLVNFVTHWLFEGNLLSQQIWVVDIPSTGYRYLHGAKGSRDTKLRENIQAPGVDGHKDEYLTECGFKFAQPLKHGKVIGITA